MAGERLVELSVKDLALVSDLRLELEPGLTVLTGETGAGKSMLVDALLAATGGRVASEMVREGASRARVEAVFSRVERVERVEQDGEDLVLSREILQGRAPARIDDRTVPLTALAERGGELVTVHGQGDQSRLAHPTVQRDLLDAYGGHAELRAAVAAEHEDVRSCEAERTRLGGDPHDRARRIELLRFQSDEIEGAQLKPGEEDELRAQLAVARSAERLRAMASSVRDQLAGERASAHDRLASALRELRAATELDARLADLVGRLETALEEVRDVAAELRRYGDSVESDPAELARLEARDELLGDLRRKYGDTVAEVIAFGERTAAELAELSSHDERLADLDRREQAARERRDAAAARLSLARRKVAKKLAKAVEAELADLGLAQCGFDVAFEPQAADGSGADRVRFLIAPNPGEPPAPIGEIASGGELSRIMLAIEVVLAAHERTPVLVFDEVDTGVGGRLGEVLGRKLWLLARHHQVLCVSHLPQVAVYADRHVRVRKEVRGDRTHVVAEALDAEASVDELSDMLGSGSARALAAGARELALGAAAWKKDAAR